MRRCEGCTHKQEEWCLQAGGDLQQERWLGHCGRRQVKVRREQVCMVCVWESDDREKVGRAGVTRLKINCDTTVLFSDYI